MNLKISSIAKPGDFQHERIVIKALVDAEVGSFALFRTRIVDGHASTNVTNAFWFPDKSIKAGDLAVLYTRSGVASEKVLESGSRAYFFYWGLQEAQWNGEDYAPVLVYTPQWELFSPSK